MFYLVSNGPKPLQLFHELFIHTVVGMLQAKGDFRDVPEIPDSMQADSADTKRSNEIDSLKCYGIIGVLFAHAEFSSRFDQNALQFVETMQWLLGWCVLSFFFCSGYLSRPVAFNKYEVQRLVRVKTARLLVPCLAFSISYRLLLLVTDHVGLSHGNSSMTFGFYDFAAFLILPVGPQFYFLPYLFGITVLLCLLESAKNWLTDLFVLTQLVLAYHFCTPLSQSYGPAPLLLPAYLTCFQMGLILRQDSAGNRLWAYVAVITALAVVESTMLANILAPLVLFLMFKRFPVLGAPELWSRLGRNSGTIFVWHAPLLMPAASIVAARSCGAGLAALMLTLFITVTGSMGAGKLAKMLPVMLPFRM